MIKIYLTFFSAILILSFCGNGFADEMAGMNMPIKEGHGSMHGFYGAYPMTRESSGTSWQPDSSPYEGIHVMHDDWVFMMHGYANAIYDIQGGPRGAVC